MYTLTIYPILLSVTRGLSLLSDQHTKMKVALSKSVRMGLDLVELVLKAILTVHIAEFVDRTPGFEFIK